MCPARLSEACLGAMDIDEATRSDNVEWFNMHMWHEYPDCHLVTNRPNWVSRPIISFIHK
jgi:hypothetical protein